jgi:hypothetical protein
MRRFLFAAAVICYSTSGAMAYEDCSKVPKLDKKVDCLVRVLGTMQSDLGSFQLKKNQAETCLAGPLTGSGAPSLTKCNPKEREQNWAVVPQHND